MNVNVVIFSLLMAAPLFAHANVSPPSPSVPDASQIFYEGKFSVKKKVWDVVYENHYGEDLDLSSHRPAVNLDGTLFAQKYAKSGTKLIGNFYHAGAFYMVRVPDQSVTRFYFHLAFFPPVIYGHYIAAHSLLRFELAPNAPLELIAPMPTPERLIQLKTLPNAEALALLPEPMTGPGTKLLNIVISAEATWTKQDKKQSYDLMRGALGAYIQVVRFESMEVRLEDVITENHPVTQFEFPLQPGQGDALLVTALQTSQDDGLRRLYNTLGYNCTTKAFDIVESVLGKDPRIGFIRKYGERVIPTIAPGKIEADGGLPGQPLGNDLASPALVEEYALAKARVAAANSGH